MPLPPVMIFPAILSCSTELFLYFATFSTGLNLISKSDCKSCHIIDKKSVGPSYLDIAAKYKNNLVEQERIAGKIITGGSGIWGDHAMSAHPQISPQDAATMIKYIISLGEKKATTVALPMKGNFVTQVPAGDNGRGDCAYLVESCVRHGALSCPERRWASSGGRLREWPDSVLVD